MELHRRAQPQQKWIVVDPRRIDLVQSPHIRAAHHLPLRPGTNVAFINAMAHVIVSEGLQDREFIARRCDQASFHEWLEFIRDPRHAPEQVAEVTGIDPEALRAAARLYATGGNGAIYYGLGFWVLLCFANNAKQFIYFQF